jgi:HK97 family phage prohead protease
MEPLVERRYLLIEDYPDALRVARRDDNAPQIGGVSPPWDSWSNDLGGFKERFLPTSFDDLLDPSGVLRSKIDVPFLFNHDPNLITGRTSNGRLEVRRGDKGLEYVHSPLQTTHGRDLVMMVEDRTIKAASFAFTAHQKGDVWEEDERGNVTRTVTRVSGLYDVSAVVYAAYGKSSAAPRSLPLWKNARSAMAHRAESRGLTISLDFDNTFTAAPGLWRSFVADAQARGNRVVCITRREDNEESRAALRTAFGDLHDELAGVLLVGPDQRKRSAAAAAGISVDIWVDDYPEGIVEPAQAGPAQAAPRGVKVSTLAGARAAAAAAAARMRIALSSTEASR